MHEISERENNELQESERMREDADLDGDKDHQEASRPEEA
jgi:hypothetical protein